MLNYSLLGIFLILSLSKGLSQKELQKFWDVNEFHTLVIESDEVFNITVTSEKTNKISVITTVQGETFENILVNVSEVEKELHLSTSYSPFFIAENDKLAAHKVIAIEMEVTVPEELSVKIKSKLASVQAKGSFRNFEAALENGNFMAKSFRSNAIIMTKKGFITVEAARDCSGSAFSKYRNVENNLPKHGKYQIKAESIYGTVSLLQTN